MRDESRLRLSPLSRAVLLGVALLLAIAAIGGYLLYSSTTKLDSDQQNDTSYILPSMGQTVELQLVYVSQMSDLAGYLLKGQKAYLQLMDTTDREIAEVQSALLANVVRFPTGRADFETIITAHRHLNSDFVNPEVALVKSGRLVEAQHIAQMSALQLLNRIRAAFTPLNIAIHQEETGNQAQVRAEQSRLILLLIVTLLALGLLLMGAAWLIVRRITQPLGRVTADAAALAEGRARHPTRWGQRGGAVTQLGAYTDAIRSRLAEHRLRSQQATEALEQQGPSVAALAHALEPRRESVAHLAVSARLFPAEGLLAGDWYDCLAVNDETLAVVVGDVSGHGPASAVLALRLREHLIACLLDGMSPGDALGRTARANEHGSEELFATVFCASVDTTTHLLSYASGGHPPALMHGPRATRRTLRTLHATGPMLSPIFAHHTWRTRTEVFLPGAGLLVYTDGVTEGRYAAHREHALEQLANDLIDLAALYPESLVDRLAEGESTLGSARDDSTLLYCRALA